MNILELLKRSPLLFHRTSIFATVLPLLIVLATCTPSAHLDGPPYNLDILPPVIQTAGVLDEQRLAFEFDEQVRVVLEDAHVDPELEIASVESIGKQIIVHFATNQVIGLAYTIRLKVEDSQGNSLSFLYKFTGWNPRVPNLIINEFNPKGSKSTPDCVELYALSDGNLGGVELVIGTEEEYIDSFIFPAIEILSRSYIVIHAKPEGTDDEIDELEELNRSGGRLATENARDFWMRKAPGLPGSNGALTLYKQRGGDIIDAVIWSNREDKPNDENLGWTSASFPWAEKLGMQGEWQSANGIPLPSEALSVTKSTATRSLCRSSVPIDSNSPQDWHIVPTSGQTFGTINNDKVYSK